MAHKLFFSSLIVNKITYKFPVLFAKQNTIFPHPILASYLLSLRSLKNSLVILSFCIGLTSCSVLKKANNPKPVAASSDKKGTVPKRDPVFIENISIKSDKNNTGKTVQVSEPIEVPEIGYSVASLSPEALTNLQFKYAILLNIAVEELYDQKLLVFLESWYGTKYRLGGSDRSGVDCSAFVQHFMSTMYDIILPRTSGEQFVQSVRILKSELQEGDLVFFRTQRRKQVSHVGIYLRNNKFVHASTSSGVMISDLSEAYYSSRFIGAGRYTSSAAGTR